MSGEPPKPPTTKALRTSGWQVPPYHRDPWLFLAYFWIEIARYHWIETLFMVVGTFLCLATLTEIIGYLFTSGASTNPGEIWSVILAGFGVSIPFVVIGYRSIDLSQAKGTTVWTLDENGVRLGYNKKRSAPWKVFDRAFVDKNRYGADVLCLEIRNIAWLKRHFRKRWFSPWRRTPQAVVFDLVITGTDKSLHSTVQAVRRYRNDLVRGL
jgi:hypothetical protein